MRLCLRHLPDNDNIKNNKNEYCACNYNRYRISGLSRELYFAKIFLFADLIFVKMIEQPYDVIQPHGLRF